MELLDRRIEVICNELKKLSVVQKIEVDKLERKHGDFIHPEDAKNAPGEWENFDSKTMHWHGKDQHDWFRAAFTVPKSFEGKSLWMNVRTQIDEWDDGRNPQFLLFVDGVPVQGIDMNHRRVKLTSKASAGRTYELELQGYTGIMHSEFNLLIDIMEVDERIEKLYYDLRVPLDAFSRMEKDDKTRRDLETVLNACINYLDLRSPYSEEFYQSIQDAASYLAKALYEDMTGYEDVIASCIGHTHIDVAWWWTVAQTREKVGRSFATALKLMEEYPNYKFMSSQPQLYVFLKERYPELYARLKERVKEGRWEPEGGMWVEADCNLTSGESLVRQFLHGKRFFKEEFGIDNRILWLPDVFGYSGALPQIMRKCGIDYFMTTKLAWNQFNKVPYDTMMWRGIDGSEVLTHLITTLGVGQSTDDFFTTYNGMLHPDAIMGGWKRYQNKEINNDILVCYGYGDGGGGPTRDMLEVSLRMEKGIKGMPKVRQVFARTYFDELKERVEGSKRLPVWEGELYFEYHRGTYTSMARNKRANRKSEIMLMDLELLSTLAMDCNVDYPRQELDAMWKKVLLNQFHDILPGSSIKEVYEVTKKEYEELAGEGMALIEERLSALTGSGEGVTVYNTLGFERSDQIELGEVKADFLEDSEGNRYPVQQSENGSFAWVDGLPAKGKKTFKLSQEDAASKGQSEVLPFVQEKNALDTPYYRIELDQNGCFRRIFDKENRREVLKDGTCGNLFRMYEDKPVNYDNWDIDVYYTEKFWDVTELTRMEWTEIGPVMAVLEMEWKISNSLIRQQICFYAKSRRIDFKTYVDWKDHQHLLKVHFPVDVHTDEAAFDIQFGNLTRKVHTNTSWDMARFESCGQKWMDLSEGRYGVSLLNDCKYGHSVKDGTIGLTLIKSGIEPNPDADQEEHYFTYALYPHAEGWRDAKTVWEAYKLNFPAYVVSGGNPGDSASLFSVDQDNVMAETVKMAEDGSGVILRMYEFENAKTRVQVQLSEKLRGRKIVECNLIEEEQGEIAVDSEGFAFVIKPYEVKTFKVCL